MRTLNSNFLRGSYPPLITPFRNGEVDYDEFSRQVDRQAEVSHGVVVTGTSGEPTSLTTAERSQLFNEAVRASSHRLPVIAATGCQSLPETLELTRAATKAGCDAVMVVTPYYSKPSQEGLRQWFEAVARETDLPVLAYHIPGRAGVSLTPETVARLAEQLENFVGVKHSSYDLLWQTEVRILTGSDFRILVGVEELSVPMLAIGADGLVNAAANVAPALIVEMFDIVMSGDLLGAREIHNRLYPLNSAVFYETNPVPVKYMMKRIGLLDSNEHRPPLASPPQSVARRLDEVLVKLNLLVIAD